MPALLPRPVELESAAQLASRSVWLPVTTTGPGALFLTVRSWCVVLLVTLAEPDPLSTAKLEDAVLTATATAP
jgi:hypothetical protein